METTQTPPAPDGISLPKWIVQRWSQYQLGNAPFSHDTDADHEFDSEEKARHYASTADSGIGGDMRYRYSVVPSSSDDQKDEADYCSEAYEEAAKHLEALADNLETGLEKNCLLRVAGTIRKAGRLAYGPDLCYDQDMQMCDQA